MNNSLKLKQLMLAGIASGILLSHHLSAEQEKKEEKNSDFMELFAKTGGNITFKEFTEDSLMLELNEEGAKLYHSLSPEGKALALKLASRSCNGLNDCKGENACATNKNKCAGLGLCKAQTKCAFSDKNMAVRIAAKKMAEKRENIHNNEETKPVSH